MKKYALVGTGGRAGLYISAIGGQWKDNAQLVAFCDTNQTRMNYANTLLKKRRRCSGIHLESRAIRGDDPRDASGHYYRHHHGPHP